MDTAETILCPSSRAKPGAKLLGIRQDNGTVEILPTVVQIDLQFVESISEYVKPEQHFRFANSCIEGSCAQWTGSRCGVADRALEFLDTVAVSDTLPECSIRPQCRWFVQSGADACKICPYILTEITEEEALAYFREHSFKTEHALMK
ncbi:MAG TPA: hypothetical protein VEW28_11055 [Candidatus Kapabacteria bacterium]|nr:hypothetical protein [Candidatus Kapabacteria bacterium]